MGSSSDWTISRTAGPPNQNATAPQSSPRASDALVRSGLALAGANDARTQSADDGLLTAVEAASLDLAGTELVVLSACDTGMGEVRTGEGVQGLRRAFAMAGASSQVMSLWQVSDDATRELMVGFYRGLIAGKGRSAALRDVQLAMRRRTDRAHPFYWAAFVFAGDWEQSGGCRSLLFYWFSVPGSPFPNPEPGTGNRELDVTLSFAAAARRAPPHRTT